MDYDVCCAESAVLSADYYDDSDDDDNDDMKLQQHSRPVLNGWSLKLPSDSDAAIFGCRFSEELCVEELISPSAGESSLSCITVWCY